MTTSKPLNELAQAIHENAAAKGFWESDRNMGEMLMLAVSELSEALEEHRKGRPVEYVPVHHQGCTHSGEGLYEPDRSVCDNAGCKPEGVAYELGDCMIRLLDTMHSLNVDIDHIVQRKMAYNATRPHKHGKAY